MPYRKVPIITNEIYHVFNKSIAGFKIFNNAADFSRIIQLLQYYQNEKPPISFVKFNRSVKFRKKDSYQTALLPKENKLVDILAYCIMKTHIHLTLKQLRENGISKFIKHVLEGYTKYFNIKYNRKGPLWEGRFKNVLVGTDEQLIHLTRYIHLNPVTYHFVDKPDKWEYSSFNEYLHGEKICKFKNILDIEPSKYKEFVNDRISYQRELAKIKKLLYE
ncbi:MAG: transposase [Endomicrobiales bacterium]|nr:transposase [Endomicrobiales bacterium]